MSTREILETNQPTKYGVIQKMNNKKQELIRITKEEEQREKFEAYKAKKARRLEEPRPVKGILFRKMVRPLMRFCLFAQRKLNGLEIEFINKEMQPTDRKRVFAVSHIGKWDFEIINEVVKPHFHIIAADFLAMNGTISGFFMNAFGVIFVDELDKADRANSKKMMEAVLRQGDNMMIFPEAAWNFSENELIYDLHFGCVDIALATDSVIVPICLEQYGKRFVINIGENYVPTERVKSIQELRDIMATLKWEIWEREGVQTRSELSYDYWFKFLEERVSEWKQYDMHGQIINAYLPKPKKEYFEILRDMRKLKITEKNSFMVMNKDAFLRKYGQ